MQKLLLLSIILCTIIIPALAARDELPKRGLRKTLFGIFAFAFLYLLALVFIYPKIFYPSSS